MNLSNLKILLRKEIRDNIRSWKFILLFLLILLTSYASVYGAYVALKEQSIRGISTSNLDSFFYLKLFTTSDGTMPSFYIFVGFLSPLLSLSLGFDAINSEFNNRTISRLLAQPIYRDSIIISKFISRLFIIATVYLSIILSVVGFLIIWTGLLPSLQEAIRILFFYILVVIYLGLWLNLAVLFSIIFKQASTAAIMGIALWIFYMLLYPMIINFVGKVVHPGMYANSSQIIAYQEFMLTIMRFSPTQLFEDGTSIMLSPLARSINPISEEKMIGAIPNPLSIKSSIQIIWSQLSALLALYSLCFALAYWLFMRREIRA